MSQVKEVAEVHCETCDYTGSAQQVATHRRMAHGAVCLERAVVFQPQCNVCGTWFRSIEGAKQHVEKGFKRGACPEHRSSFKGIVDENPVDTWTCNICQGELHGVANIRAHMLIHMGQVCQWKGYVWPVVSELCEKIRAHEVGVEGDDLINGSSFAEDSIPFLPPKPQREREVRVPAVREEQPKRVRSNVDPRQSRLSSFGFVRRSEQAVE